MPGALRNRTQNMLIDFLRAEIDIAHTFLQTAEIDSATDVHDSRVAHAKARKALATVRHLLSRVRDPATSAEIKLRADELRIAIQVQERNSSRDDKIFQRH